MKVLMANSFHYNRGGDCTYTFALTKLLESKGHQVIPFAMSHPQNLESAFSDYFVSRLDYDGLLKSGSWVSRLRAGPKFIYSLEAKKKFERLICDTRPDIVHLQGVHHLITLSVLHSSRKFNLPVVWTLHDYSLICPNSNFRRRGVICENCRGGKFYHAVIKKCRRDSVAASLIVCLSSYVNWWLKGLVDLFISPSLFLKNKLVAHGVDSTRLVFLPHFVDQEERFNSEDSKESNYCIYAGRLSPEKGLKTLIDAMEGINIIELVIAGEGPMETYLRQKVEKKHDMRVRFVGHLSEVEMQKTLAGSRFLILPSECYEVFGYVVLEAFAQGKPALVSRIGGPVEYIQDGQTGMFFEPGNVDDLRSKIVFLASNPEAIAEMGKKAQRMAKLDYGTEEHYNGIMSLYEELIESKKRGQKGG